LNAKISNLKAYSYSLRSGPSIEILSCDEKLGHGASWPELYAHSPEIEAVHQPLTPRTLSSTFVCETVCVASTIATCFAMGVRTEPKLNRGAQRTYKALGFSGRNRKYWQNVKSGHHGIVMIFST
jgi:hypothetical protein